MTNYNIKCKHCGSINISKQGYRKTQHRGKIQKYYCEDCKKYFTFDDGFYSSYQAIKNLQNRKAMFLVCPEFINRAERGDWQDAARDGGSNHLAQRLAMERCAGGVEETCGRPSYSSVE